ncbi:uncharacterized protein IL334_005689 [Kwoniella shivajii]|uniref:Signal peptidase complex subunit 2 n=1 Tax=Kwoniella shivajii TaxID=564305 RepID=A0ABZ1D3U5_9TREE|nr:hypothetical protein IL334_005689 [Kwoniella shivajii]
MANKESAKGGTVTSTNPTMEKIKTKPDEPISITTLNLTNDSLPVVMVNNANLGEIKSALDDIVKSHLQNQSFTPSLLHPTVHLSLGYSSVIIALSSVLYSYKVEFENSKSILWIAVIIYTILQITLWGWKRWVEKGEVFKGKRRRMVKRIETDHIQIISSTSLSSPPIPQISFSPHTRPSSPTSIPTSPNQSYSSSFSNSPTIPSTPSSTLLTPQTSNSGTNLISSTTTTTSTSTSTSTGEGPSYILQLNLSTTSNNGKSLIHKSRSVVGKSVGEFIDQQGGVESGEVNRWLLTVLGEAGLVGSEEIEGSKEE